MATFVRTVLGDLDPNRLGRTYCHEHLIIDSPLVAEGFPHIHLPSVEEAVAEVELCRQAGVEAMVDTMPVGGGGNLEKLRRVSRRTGLHLVAAAGIHHARYYRDDPAFSGDLTGTFVAEIGSGCGVIKVAAAGATLTSRDRLALAAAADAHLQTGAPVITHCEDGRGGLEQVAFLAEAEVDPSRVVLSHTDKVPDHGYHRELLATGVNLEYDQGLRLAAAGGEPTLSLLAAMIAEGFGSQLMLGTDGARRTLWATLGGSPGLAWLISGLVPLLTARVGGEGVEAVLVDNPRRWLTFTPSWGR
jgi:predicted metal-dependent phosphotriesterase family hydrolase